jgi:hypothetical protein
MRIRVTSFVEKRKQEYILYIFKVQSKRHWHADTFKIFHLILYFEMESISRFITKRLKWKTIYRVSKRLLPRPTSQPIQRYWWQKY